MADASAGKRYRAFISYSHRDKAHVEGGALGESVGFPIWLHRRLERYVVPAGLRREEARNGRALPERLGRVFRDDEEFGAEEDLAASITRALEQSENILVMCSPHAAASPYVNEEVRRFKHLSGGENVFALILSGKPHAPDAALECFPKALRHEIDADGAIIEKPVTREPVAADLQQFDRETVFLKIVAGMLGVEFGRLRDREKQAERARRRRAVFLFAAGLVLTALAALGLTLAGLQTWANAEARADLIATQAGIAMDAHDYDRGLLLALAAAPPRLGGFAPSMSPGVEAQLFRAALNARLHAAGAVKTQDARIAIDGDIVRVLQPIGDEIRVYDMPSTIPRIALADPGADWDALAAAGPFVASGAENQLRLFKLCDGCGAEPVETLTFDAEVMAAGLSPDATALAVATNDGTVRVYALSEDGAARLDYARPRLGVANELRLSRGGDRVGMYIGALVVIGRESSEPLMAASFGGHIADMALSPDGKLAAWGGAEGETAICEVDACAPFVWNSGESTVESLAFSPDGAALASFGVNGRLWRVRTFRDPYSRGVHVERAPLAELTGFVDTMNDAAFSADGRYLAAVDSEGAARAWRADFEGDLVATVRISDYERGALGIRMSPDGEALALYDVNAIRIIDADTGDIRADLPTCRDEGDACFIYDIAFLGADGAIVARMRSGALTLFPANGGAAHVIENLDAAGGVERLANGDVMVMSRAPSGEGFVAMRLGSGAEAARVAELPHAAYGFDGEGRRALLGRLMVRDLESGEERSLIEALPQGSVEDSLATLSPDGTLAVGVWETSMFFKRADTLADIAPLTNARRSWAPFEFAPDSSWFAATADNALIWDARAGVFAGAILSGSDVEGSAASPDGRTLYTLDYRGQVRRHSIPPRGRALIDYACARLAAGRETFSPQEMSYYPLLRPGDANPCQRSGLGAGFLGRAPGAVASP
jgi:WD40 repeat protein